MARPDEHHVYLGVFEFGNDPTVVTEIVGVQPTKAWSKGDPWGEGTSAWHTHSRWTLQSDLPLTDPIEKHIDRLLPMLEERADAVREVAEKFQATMTVAAYFYDSQPGFRLSHDQIRRISDLNLALDFDLYCLAGVDDDD